MNRTKPLLLFIATLLACYTQAQFTVTAFASRDTICKGESVQLGFAANFTGAINCTTGTPSCGMNGDKTDSLSIERLSQTGSNVFTWTLYGVFFNCTKSQILYTAQDLFAEFGGAGYIKSLAWKTTTFNSNATIQNYKIRMGCIPADSTTLSTWNNDLATVYSSPTYTPIPGWNNHNLPQAYFWDGISNLVIEVTSYTPNVTGNLINFMEYTNKPNSVLYARSNNDIRDSVVALTSWHERPNMRLRMCLADSSMPAIVTWHLLDSNAVFSNSTNPSFFPTTTNTYRAKVIYGGDTVFSNPVTVVVNENIPPVIQASEDSIVCADEVMDIVLSVGNYSAYEWTNGYTTATTHITQPGLYDVTVTNAFNCNITFSCNQAIAARYYCHTT